MSSLKPYFLCSFDPISISPTASQSMSRCQWISVNPRRQFLDLRPLQRHFPRGKPARFVTVARPPAEIRLDRVRQCPRQCLLRVFAFPHLQWPGGGDIARIELFQSFPNLFPIEANTHPVDLERPMWSPSPRAVFVERDVHPGEHQGQPCPLMPSLEALVDAL
jgi:hypothetical protein